MDSMAKTLGEQTKFDRGLDKMYFYVREGFAMTNLREGFSKRMTITSEMFKGQAIVDGWFKTDLAFGD